MRLTPVLTPATTLVLLLAFATTTLAQPEDQWMRFFGGEEVDNGRNIKATSDGGFVLLGQTQSLNPVEGNVVVVKIDRNGNRHWRRIIPQARFVGSIQILNNDDIMLVGYTYDDSRVVQMDCNGLMIWEYVFDHNQPHLEDIASTPDGGFMVVGSHSQNADVLIIRLDDQGQELWTSCVEHPDNQFVSVIEPRVQGGYAIFGSTGHNEPITYDYFMMLVDEDGEEEEFHVYDYGGAEFLRAGIALGDGFLIAGEANWPSESVAIRLNSDGETMWEQPYSQAKAIYGLTEMPSGGFAYAGYSINSNAWIIKVDDQGNQDWELLYATEEDDRMYGIVADNAGVIYSYGMAAQANDLEEDAILWVVGSEEPISAPQVTIYPRDSYPVFIPAEGRTFRYYLDLMNERDVPIDVRVRQRAYTPSETHVTLAPLINYTLPPNSQQTFENLRQPVPDWAPPGRYAFVIELLDADTDSVIAEDSVVLRKFEE
jgi:hypothetical protein